MMRDMKMNTDIETAHMEFVKTVLSCYIYLIGNGMKGDFAKKLLSTTLENTINDYEQSGGFYENTNSE